MEGKRDSGKGIDCDDLENVFGVPGKVVGHIRDGEVFPPVPHTSFANDIYDYIKDGVVYKVVCGGPPQAVGNIDKDGNVYEPIYGGLD